MGLLRQILSGRSHRHSVAVGAQAGDGYRARHLAWYLDSDNLDEEERYYRAHADISVANWNADKPAAERRP